jgi:replicative DNA helicase
LERVNALEQRGELVTGVPTGFKALDLLTAGWQETDLIVIAGRPSMGKTALALACTRAASRAGRSVGYISLEMSAEQLVARLVGAESGIDVHAMRTGRLPHDGWKKLALGTHALEAAPIWVDASPLRTVAHLRAKARRLKANQGLGLLVIDYLQLLEGHDGDSRQEIVAGMSRALKLLAKELEVPILLLSQLNRKCEERPDKRPLPSDLRESGAIEQDADVVGFLYREEVYDPLPENQGMAEFAIRKHRNGPIGLVRMGFTEHLAAFIDLDGEGPRA